MVEIRKFRFGLREAQSDNGVIKVIGRASRKDPNRIAQGDNLFYDERSLSRNHALLGLKLMEPLEAGTSMVDQFRIYVKDLESSYGIVDLNSHESDPFIIDLKNGERFGLINLNQPTPVNQLRGAKLKFQIDINDVGQGEFECRITDVSFDNDSPSSSVTMPSTCTSDIEFLDMLQAFSGSESDDTACASEDDLESISQSSFYSETSESYALLNICPSAETDVKERDLGESRPSKKRVLPAEYGDNGNGNENKDTELPPRKRAKAGRMSRRDFITGTIGFLLGSMGTIGFLIGIAGAE